MKSVVSGCNPVAVSCRDSAGPGPRVTAVCAGCGVECSFPYNSDNSHNGGQGQHTTLISLARLGLSQAEHRAILQLNLSQSNPTTPHHYKSLVGLT